MRVLKLLIVSTLIILLFLLFLLIIGLLCSSIFKRGGRRKGFEHRRRMKYRRFDPQTNRSTVGFVNTELVGGDDTFISFQDEFGGNVLISDFETTEYKCLGTCVCEDDTYRRATIIMLKNVIYFVAALSSYIAYDLAKEYYETECKSLCPLTETTNIRSEVDDCDFLWEPNYLPTYEEQKEYLKDYVTDEYMQKKGGFEVKGFICEGQCLTDEIPQRLYKQEEEHILWKKKNEEFGCDKLTMQEYYSPPVTKERYLSPGETQISKVELQFTMYVLHYHCYMSSLIPKEEDIHDLKSHCVGHIEHNRDEYTIEKNPTVKCIEAIEPSDDDDDKKKKMK